MIKITTKVYSIFCFLIVLVANAQISTGTGGGGNVLSNTPSSNINVGIGTTNPTAKLEVNGDVKVKNIIFSGESFPDGQTFIDLNDRNLKCGVFQAGSFVNANSRMMKFLDFPASNINAKSMFWFAIDDRSDNQRFRSYAQTSGYGGFEINDSKQRNVFKVLEDTTPDGCNFSHASLPNANTKLIIGASYESLTSDENIKYKLIIKAGTCGSTFLDGSGSAFIEGNTVSMGNIGVGTTNFIDGSTTYRLSVKGKIRAEEIKVYNTWADYVFSKNYKLPTLKEVETYIAKNGHLPNVPSAKEITEKGLELGEMTKIQQEKIEELTLYVIQQNKENEQLHKDIEELKAQVKILLEKR
ncbi:hypothetical protein [Flavobacterium chilense]|uniref:Uncharacterized protein n=1 Tax=Flavobacterium chilense TaxID=946677 RepID=A0A1M6XYN1_9FLAO|nr:hypothetical protein [Flavobacterium chilense]SHL11016.1 hypothetical protein SAMN05444484_101338 [Flavobacterium chilense]